MRFTRLLATGALIIWAPLPAAAEPDLIDELSLPGYDHQRSSSSWIELDLAPELVTHNPLTANTHTSGNTSLSLTFITVQPLSEALELEFDIGPSVTIDHAPDTSAGSSLGAAIELRTRQNASGFSAFASYGIGRSFDDVFGAGQDTTHVFTTGLRYGVELGIGHFGAELAPRYVTSTQDLDEYLAAELFLEAVVPIITDGAILIAEAALDRRWYQRADPVLEKSRRDWRFEAFFGIDFAGALSAGRSENLFRSLGVGVLWSEVDSNFSGAQRSEILVLPAITLALPL